MGLEGMCYALLDDPGLIEEMCEFHTDFILRLIRRAVEEVDVDYVNFWEDMAYRGGSLISPAHVRRYMLPGYRRIAHLLRSHGIDLLFVDSDGNIEQLIPIWLEAGINGVWPLEVAAGMDPLALRREYGKDLLLVGGIDKGALRHTTSLPSRPSRDRKKKGPSGAAGQGGVRLAGRAPGGAGCLHSVVGGNGGPGADGTAAAAGCAPNGGAPEALRSRRGGARQTAAGRAASRALRRRSRTGGAGRGEPERWVAGGSPGQRRPGRCGRNRGR